METNYCTAGRQRTRKIVYLFIASIGVVAVYMYVRHHIDHKKAEEIFAVMDSYRVLYDVDAASVDPSVDTTPLSVEGKTEFVKQLARFVQKGKALEMVVVSLPFKSPNHEKKTFGNAPDMAERKSLEYVASMLAAIKTVYAPGAHLTIFCDGAAFAEFLHVPYQHVKEYEDALRMLAQDFSSITFYTSDNFMRDHKLTCREDINKILDAYVSQQPSPTPKPISEHMRRRFAHEFDYKEGEGILKQQSLDQILMGIIARENSVRAFVNKHFPKDKYLYLTTHFSADMGKKFAIKFSPDSQIMPYFGVLVQEVDGTWRICSKCDVDQHYYEQMTTIIHGVKCPYFERKKYV